MIRLPILRHAAPREARLPLWRIFAAAVALCLGAPLAAAPPADDDEPAASVSHPVVEPVAPSAGKALNAALERLARDPRNVEALTNAGSAALTLGDNEAALGFFARAEQIAPGNAAVKVAMAGAQLRLGDPVEALGRYAEAERAGADPAGFALDRGLAFDLVADNAAAAAQYRLVIARSGDAALRDEAARRLAISLAIAGDRRAADTVLLDQLQRQDRAGWRAHVFVLAIAGKADEAVALARATLPADLAGEVGPYLRFIGRLTPSQQAAAASLGRFPRAADIGRDDPRIAAYVLAHPHAATAVQLATAAAAADAGAQADAAPDPRARKHRRGGTGTPAAPAAPLRIAAATPDPVLPPPPPPPFVAAPAPAPRAAPVPPAPMAGADAGFDLGHATGGVTPDRVAAAPGLPQPTVLSRLDLPPAPRAAKPARAPLASAPPAAPQAAPVVQPVPAPVVAAPAPAAVAKPDRTKAKADADAAAKAKPAPDHRAEAKKAHDRKAADSDTASLEPCPPKAKAKAKAAAKPAKAGRRHGRHTAPDEDRPAHGKGKAKGKGKGKAGAKSAPDDETCATRGERPDGPSGVSRDSDEDRPAKGKGDKAAKDKKGKGRDKDKDAETGKSGRKARYASRIWVQVLTGGDRDKMAGEWRALVRKAHPLKGHKPFITAWHSNFRLLTGPFDSDSDAQDFIAQLRKDGVSGFEWTSPAGQAVDSLALD